MLVFPANVRVLIFALIAAAVSTGNVSAQELIKITGIEIPVSKFKAKRGGKPSSPTYYAYHFKPRSNKPVPYLIYIPSSTTEVFSRNSHVVKDAARYADEGYGVIVIDINRGVTGSKEYNGLVGAPPRAIGALSFIKYITEEYPALSNGRFGAYGRSKGGSTGIEINKIENRDGAFIYRNVDRWFDALAAYYPTCGDNNLVAPQLILIGEEDDWTSAADCRGWESSGNSGNLTVHYFPGATHLFDYPNMGKGELIRGHKVRYDKETAVKARKLMLEFFDRHLKFDSIDYRQAQQLLNEAGFSVGTVDGQFGRNSISALREFQESVGLEPTGMLDQETQAKLKKNGSG